MFQQSYASIASAATPVANFVFGATEHVVTRFICAAFDFDPREADTLVYAVGDEEYLVPVKNYWKNDMLTRSEVFINRVHKILARPDKTRCISAMQLSQNVSDEIRLVLLDQVRSWFKPQAGYEVQIVK